jgi:hypothetical protein
MITSDSQVSTKYLSCRKILILAKLPHIKAASHNIRITYAHAGPHYSQREIQGLQKSTKQRNEVKQKAHCHGGWRCAIVICRDIGETSRISKVRGWYRIESGGWYGDRKWRMECGMESVELK